MKNASLLRSEELNRGYHIIDMRPLPSKRGLIGWSVTFPSNIKDKLFFLFDTKTIDCPSVGPSSQLMSAETLENASLASRVFSSIIIYHYWFSNQKVTGIHNAQIGPG